LADIFGRRRLLLIGIALFIVASSLCGLARADWWLIAARAVQGHPHGGGVLALVLLRQHPDSVARGLFDLEGGARVSG
jgi:MFS family permease